MISPMKLTDEQREKATAYRDKARNLLDDCLAALIKARASGPGMTSRKLATYLEEIMVADRTFAHWEQLLGMDGSPKSTNATLVTLHAYHLRDLKNIRPVSYGGGEGYRVEERCRHAALRDLIEALEDRMGGQVFGHL